MVPFLVETFAIDCPRPAIRASLDSSPRNTIVTAGGYDAWSSYKSSPAGPFQKLKGFDRLRNRCFARIPNQVWELEIAIFAPRGFGGYAGPANKRGLYYKIWG